MALGSQEHHQELLPGILDDITLEEISTKLSRKELHVLACVSRGWKDAIHDYMIHDARVRSRLIEPFVILEFADMDRSLEECHCPHRALVLCCLRDNSYFELPPIPHLDGGIPWSQCVTLDGRVYVLGGMDGCPSDQVYMLDLAGLRPWTQCACMHFRRSNFGCAVMDGKIYVFGGVTTDRFLCEAEVFDPKQNSWSLIKPMRFTRCNHRILVVGDELFLFGGVLGTGEDAHECFIYHPVKDEWRCKPDDSENLIFVGDGKLWEMFHLGVYCNTYTKAYDNSFDSFVGFPGYNVQFNAESVLVVDDEILAAGSFDAIFCPRRIPRNYYVIRSRGFGTEKEVLEWQEQSNWPRIIRAMHLIHL